MGVDADPYLVRLRCPTCAHRFDRTLGSLKGRSSVRCPACRKPLVPRGSGLRLMEMARTIKSDRSRLHARVGPPPRTHKPKKP